AAGDAVGHLVLLEFDFQQARLVVAAIENGVVVKTALVANAVTEDFGGHPLGFGVFVGAADNANGVAQAHFAPQRLIKVVGIVGDQMVGDAQNTAGGAIVLLQLDHLQLGIVAGELRHVFRAGAAP